MDSVERKVQLLLMARLHPGEGRAIMEGMSNDDLQEALKLIEGALEDERSEPPPCVE